MAYKVRFRGASNIKIGRVVTKIVAVLIALWVGGEILTSVGAVMENTTSPFYQGLTLIGWTVGAFQNNGTHWATSCGGDVSDGGVAVETGTNCITDVSGNGVLVVVGLVGIASVILEFVQFSKIG